MISIRHRALLTRCIPFETQVPIEICFEGVIVARARIDLVVAKQIVVERKTVESLREVHFVQLKSYLRATGLRIGLLLNFNAPTLATKRMVVG